MKQGGETQPVRVNNKDSSLPGFMLHIVSIINYNTYCSSSSDMVTFSNLSGDIKHVFWSFFVSNLNVLQTKNKQTVDTRVTQTRAWKLISLVVREITFLL